jgi:hypothetical protein
MHLVCFWPSPTSMARRERQRGASGVRWWVGTARPVLCAGGVLFPCKMTPFIFASQTPPRLRTGESMHLVCFWPSPTSRARRERQRGASGVRWWVGTARQVLCAGGVLFPCKINDPVYFRLANTAPSPHRRIDAPSLLLAFAHVQGEAGTPTGGRRECGGGSEQPARFCVQEGCFFRVK